MWVKLVIYKDYTKMHGQQNITSLTCRFVVLRTVTEHKIQVVIDIVNNCTVSHIPVLGTNTTVLITVAGVVAFQGSKRSGLVGCNPSAASIYILYNKSTDFTCLVSNICSRSNTTRIFFCCILLYQIKLLI